MLPKKIWPFEVGSLATLVQNGKSISRSRPLAPLGPSIRTHASRVTSSEERPGKVGMTTAG